MEVDKMVAEWTSSVSNFSVQYRCSRHVALDYTCNADQGKGPNTKSIGKLA